MRLLLYVVICIGLAFADENIYQPEYFIKKHSLNLPHITPDMSDISRHSYILDIKEYFYLGSTSNLDSVIRYIHIKRPIREYERYLYLGDTTISKVVSITEKGDTVDQLIVTSDRLHNTRRYVDLESQCMHTIQLNEWGKKIVDKAKCSGDKEFSGQEVEFRKNGNCTEAIPKNNGIVDSNGIRKYYLNSFNNIVAEYSIDKRGGFRISQLITYNVHNNPIYQYNIIGFDKWNFVEKFNHYVYDSSGRLKRDYLYKTADRKKKKKGFQLVNYTEYEYDDLGRKIRMITYGKGDSGF